MKNKPVKVMHGFLAYTDNPTGYAVQNAGKGKVTVIPPASIHGKSPAFDTKPGVVYCDPNPQTNEGGFAVDMSKVTPQIAKWAYEKAKALGLEQEEQTVKVYQFMAEAIKDKEILRPQKKAKQKPLDVAVKKADDSDQIKAMFDLIQQLSSRLDDNEKEQQESNKHSLSDVFNIPYLDYEPDAPRIKVEFDLGRLGKQLAHYHWVNSHNNIICLVYDERFKYGMQYKPPALGEEFDNIRISIFDQYEQETFIVSSDALEISFGVFNITIWLVMPDANQDYTESGSDVMRPLFEEQFSLGIDENA